MLPRNEAGHIVYEQVVGYTAQGYEVLEDVGPLDVSGYVSHLMDEFGGKVPPGAYTVDMGTGHSVIEGTCREVTPDQRQLPRNV